MYWVNTSLKFDTLIVSATEVASEYYSYQIDSPSDALATNAHRNSIGRDLILTMH
jgi:hypothetical protein